MSVDVDPRPSAGLRRAGWGDRLLHRYRRPAPPVYREHRYVTLVVLLGLVALVVPEVVTSRSDQYLVNLWLVYSIAAVGFYWVFGLAGRFAFCQTFMMALGGYTSAWVVAQVGDSSFLLGLAAAMVVTAVAAALIGLAANRAKHFYFAIATLAVAEVGTVVFTNATAFTGPNGTVSGIPPIELFGRTYLTDIDVFWVLIGFLALVMLVGVALERSPVRRDALAGRDNDTVAKALGVPVLRVQVVLFALGSAAGGLSGALIGHWTGSIGLDSFGLDLAIGIFLMLLLGGIDSQWGPVVGAAFYVAIPEVLSGLEQYKTIIYGGLLLVVIIAFPQGIVGAVRQLVAKLRRRRPNPPPDLVGRFVGSELLQRTEPETESAEAATVTDGAGDARR